VTEGKTVTASRLREAEKMTLRSSSWCMDAHSMTIPKAREGRLPEKIASVLMLTHASSSPYSASKWGGLWSS
jgi:hypothetical protein